jgi:hypothetical protein
MSDTATYLIFRYVADPFRGEQRNVGVAAFYDGRVATRFFGQFPDGSLDGRRIKSFGNPGAYRQWVEYWRATTRSADPIPALLGSSSANYQAAVGGEVSDVGGSAVEDVVGYLYNLLVAEKAFAAAIDPEEAASDAPARTAPLVAEVELAFAEANILEHADDALALVPHPIMRGGTVPGKSVAAHRPQFTQMNGLLYVIESCDFSSGERSKARAKDHAGCAAFMFEDIRRVAQKARAIGIYSGTPEDFEDSNAKYGLDMLKSAATDLVHWDDLVQRSAFLQERHKVAMAGG